MAKRVAEWSDRMDPLLSAQAAREEHSKPPAGLEADILTAVVKLGADSGASPSASEDAPVTPIDFAAVLRTARADPRDVPRLFLAALQLANNVRPEWASMNCRINTETARNPHFTHPAPPPTPAPPGQCRHRRDAPLGCKRSCRRRP